MGKVGMAGKESKVGKTGMASKEGKAGKSYGIAISTRAYQPLFTPGADIGGRLDIISKTPPNKRRKQQQGLTQGRCLLPG